ncbi:MAG: molybdenum cofactor guanylyltransferase [Cyanobacteria bacterium P01_E01_bin.45]
MTRNQDDVNNTADTIVLDAIVLAGGRSRRMGEDKALLELNRVPLLQRVCDVASTCVRQTYVVTPWGDRYSHLNLPATIVPEPERSERARGPLTGFACGLRVTQSEWVLLLACDLPCLSTAGLQQGVERLEQVPSDSIAFLHPHPKGWEPLCGFYRQHCLHSLQQAISTGTRSFQDWLSEQAIAVWEDADSQLFLNCNTPEEWLRASK